MEPTPRIAGNDQYYADIEQEMTRLGCDMRTAEIELLHNTIKGLRAKGWAHHQIQTQFDQFWGLKKSAYQVRLQWIRQLYALP